MKSFSFVFTRTAALELVAVLVAAVFTEKTETKTVARRRHVQPFVYHIEEQLPVGSFVANLTGAVWSACRDAQKTNCDNSPSRFTQLHQRPVGNSLFTVNETSGLLRTAADIDREQICTRWKPVCFVVLEIAIHYPDDGAFDVIIVEVYIDDINDNAPVFSASSPLRLSVLETALPGDPIATFQLALATDADSPVNSVTGYRLLPETDSSHEYFRLTYINSSTAAPRELRLSLVSALDREWTPQHQLTLVAYDGGVPPLSASLLIVIDVADANDNRPVFDRPQYEVTVAETAEVGAEVVVIRAVDADAGVNGRVRYRFSARGRGRDDFELDERSGVVLVARRLDFARQSDYNLGILAQDDGIGDQASFAMLTVRIVDVNGHSPAIEVNTAAGQSGTVTIDVVQRHDVAPVTAYRYVEKFVADISVSDDDGGENGAVACWLDTSSVNTTKDWIADEFSRSNVSLQRPEANDSHLSLDSTSRYRRNHSIDDIAVFDMEELFEDEYKVTVNVSGMAADWRDRDATEYHLSVTCHDHGSPLSLTSSVAIHVTLRYDDVLSSATPDSANTAQFSRIHFIFPTVGNDTVYAPAGLSVGQVVATLRAEDIDDTDTSLSYEMLDGNGSTYFDVDRSCGHVTVAKQLPIDNSTLQLIVGVGATSDQNKSVILLAELYVVVTTGVQWTDLSFVDMTSAPPLDNNAFGRWSVWLSGQNWSNLILIVVVSCSLVLGAVLFAAIFFVCRKSRGAPMILDRRHRSRRKLTSSYHVAVEFTATDDGLNNVSMLQDVATASRAPGGGAGAGLLTSSNSCIGSMQALYGKPTVDHACNINDEVHFTDKAKAMSLPDILLVDFNPCEALFDAMTATSDRNREAYSVHHDSLHQDISCCTQTFLDHRQDVGAVDVEATSSSCACGRCLRCGLPVRSATLPSFHAAAPSTGVRQPPYPTATGSRSCDVMSGSKERKKCVKFEDDVRNSDVAASVPKKRVRFSPAVSYSASSTSLEAADVPSPSPLGQPSSSFIQVQTLPSSLFSSCHSQLSATSSPKLTTFIDSSGSASLV